MKINYLVLIDFDPLKKLLLVGKKCDGSIVAVNLAFISIKKLLLV
jgi:hypothetical protein